MGSDDWEKFARGWSETVVNRRIQRAMELEFQTTQSNENWNIQIPNSCPLLGIRLRAIYISLDIA